MFLSLHIILERMLVEGLVDVFQTVKNLRIQRPAMVQTLVWTWTCINQTADGIIKTLVFCFQEQYHLCYDAALTFLQSSEFLMPAAQPVLNRQRANSQRNSQRNSGSRHGSMGSVDSRKKSFNSSPTRSPMRSVSQRNTPMRSESFKDSPKGTMELGSSLGGGAHVYGGSDATSTFGSHCTPPPAAVPPATMPPASQGLSGSQSQLTGSHTQLSGSHTQLSAAHSVPVGVPLQMPSGNPQPTSVDSYTPASAVVHTPVMGVHTPMAGTPVPVVASSQSHTPMSGSLTPVVGSHTPVMGARSAPSDNPVQLQRGAVSTTESSQIYHGYHGSLPHSKNEPQLLFNGTSSPLPAPGAGYTLSQTPSGFTGSQSPVYNGSHDAFGSQSQSSMFSDSSLLLPASTTVNTSQLNSNVAAPHLNSTQHYHQLLEQKHAPAVQFPLGPESTPL